jgi:hypothetical protein
VAGFRNSSNGSLDDVGSGGRYWSGSVSGSVARRLIFANTGTNMFSDDRARGDSVRCLKD